MSLFVTITLSIFLLFIFILAALLGIGYRAKKEYRSNRTLQKKSTMNFNDSSYTMTRDDNNPNYREWDNLHSIRETKRGFFLFYSLNTVIYVPKRGI